MSAPLAPGAGDGTVAGAEPLVRRSVRGGLSIVFARGGADAIRLVSMLVLARLLTPDEFGVVAMVVVVVGLAEVVQDLGLSAAAVQRHELTARQVSTLFWMNVGLGLLGAVAVFAAADVGAEVLRDARIADGARLLAPMFLISALGTQHLAMLRRHLHFTRLAQIRIAAAIVYGIVSVALALADVGYRSLIWGLLASSVVQTSLAFCLSRFRPGRPKYDRSTKEMAGYGLNLIGFVVLNYAAANVQAVFIGRFDGAAATGLYGRAQRLVAASTGYLVGPIDGVAFPVLSRLAADPPRWAAYFQKAHRVIVITTAGTAPLLVVLSDEIVGVLLGPEWSEAAPVLAILAVAIVAQGLCSPAGWIFQSLGSTNRMLRWGLFGWTVVLVGTLVGVPHGITGVAWGFTVASTLLVWPCLWYAFRGTNLAVSTVLRPLVPVFLAAAASSVVSLLVADRLMGLPETARLGGVLIAHVTVYLLLLLTVAGQRELLTTIFEQVRRRDTTSIGRPA